MSRALSAYTAACLTLAALILAAGHARADKVAPNRSYETTSPQGKVRVYMEPAVPYGEQGRGRAADGRTGKLLWTVDWYARRVVALDDGSTLIRPGPWAQDHRNLSDLALAFYRRGRLVKKYAVRDLLEDPTRIMRTASHYFWRSRDDRGGLSADQRRYVVNLIDGSRYTFDTASGEVISREP